jgi:3-oxoacyl-[acyl-carrier-protein] synthase II
MGAVTPLGFRVEEIWDRVLKGHSGVGVIQRFDASRFRSRIGGEILNFSMDGYIEPKEVKKFDRFVQYAYVSGVDAVRDSGIDFSREDLRRCSVILGSGIGGLETIEVQQQRLLDKGPEKVSAFTIPKLISNAASAQLAILYKLHGPNHVIVTACASATNALGEVFKMIQRGEIDVALSGGSEAALTPIGMSAFAAMRALSERNDDPQRASRPFDRDRDGFVLSEGAGMMLLEEYEHAKARGAKIYAELYGYGVTCDAGHITQPDQEGFWPARAMEQSLNDAQLDPAGIDYINTHGTSTPLGDIAETKAIKSVFKEHARSVSISSTKSQLGHLLGASGGIELILSILAIRDGVIPPTINLDHPDPECDLDYTPNTARLRKLSTALSNSFGFGGHNGCLVVGKLRNG